MITQSGLTPLHLAAQEDKVNVAEVLLNHGADVNPQTKVEHMLILAFFLCVSSYMSVPPWYWVKILSDTLPAAHKHFIVSGVA